MARHRDKKFDINKYNDPERRVKLSYDFAYLASWMTENTDSALELSAHVLSAQTPRRTIAESTENAKKLSHVVTFCNAVLSAPENSDKHNNKRLRTAIRRIADFTTTITDPLDCQKKIPSLDIIE